MISERTHSVLRGAAAIVVVLAAYEAMARSGMFPSALLPTLPKVADRLVELIADGTMFWHVTFTLYRMLTGFALAVAIGLPLGILMGRFRAVENFFLPLVSALMPIPSLAWVPVFILWLASATRSRS
jgi:NitT/TauT family transport system permease protein